MKVLHLLYSNKYSGAENVACQIINMFKEDIEMAYCSPDGDIRNTLKDKQIKFLPLESFTVKSLKKIVKDYKPNVIHCHDFRASILGSKIKGIKIISHVHGNKSKMNILSIKSIYYYLTCKKYDNIIWVSKSCLNSFKFKNRVKHKSLVLPNIISIKNLKDKVNQDKNSYDFDIVYVGRLVYEKNPIRLIEIAKKIKNRKPDFKFAIIGDGCFRQEMKEKVKEYMLQDNIKFFGYMDNPYKILSCSKVMLMTSIMEGTPMCALESMVLGVPVISTKTDGMVDLIKENINGCLYDNDEVAVDKIIHYITSEKSLSSLKQKVINFAEQYNNIEYYMKKIRDVYLD